MMIRRNKQSTVTERDAMPNHLSIALCVACALAIASGSAMAADATKGQSIFKKRCAVCHSNEQGKNKVGPSLFGVVDREAGTVPKFRYSKSYIEAGKKGLTWTQDKIVAYLKDPKAFMIKVSGDPKAKTRMVFKLKPEDERKAVAAYLATVK